MNTEIINKIASRWGFSCRRIRHDITIPGSPERCLERVLIEDEKGNLLVLEKIPRHTLKHKLRIVQTLQYLYTHGLSCIQPYLHNSRGDFIAEVTDEYYQIVPFVAGIDLSRPSYVADGWRGIVAADFLADLRQASLNVPYFTDQVPFSVKTYIEGLAVILRQHEPSLHEALLPALSFLDDRFMGAHDHLPLAFCHGDYHPLNIIWGTDSIGAVIDWEFSGYKPEIYDVALLIGCIGIEDPEGLLGEMVLNFIHTLRTKSLISDSGWNVLLEFVIATRFAWLAEWLRKRDGEMVNLELVYLKLLMDHAEMIRKTWAD
jgi:homoserine kinase type II